MLLYLSASIFQLPAPLNFFANLLFGFENRTQMLNFARIFKNHGKNRY